MKRMHRLARTQQIDQPLDNVFGFFSDAANLPALTPAFLRFRIRTPGPIEMKTGVQIDYTISLFGIPLRWRTRITDWQPGVRFVDEQEAGPYAVWRHTHEFEARGGSTLVRDVVEYVEPLGALGALAHFLFVERLLGRIFDFRHEATRRLLAGGDPLGSQDRRRPDGQRASP